MVKCQVLILDDQENFTSRIAAYLQRVNGGGKFDVTPTTRIEEAILRASQASQTGKPYDIFLIDMRLNEPMDGVEVMRRLKNISPQSSAIILTGWEDPDDGLRAVKAGASRYLTKNAIEPEELVLALDALDDWRKLQRERDWLQTFSEIAEHALHSTTYPETARIIAHEALRLGFERVRLYACPENNPAILTGICQEGEGVLAGFEDREFQLDSSPYLESALHQQTIQFYTGRERGPGVMEIAFGADFLPPKGEWAVLPLSTSRQPVGVMVLENVIKNRYIYYEERNQLGMFASVVAGFLERSRLLEQEHQDLLRLDQLHRASVELLNLANHDDEKMWLVLLTLATASYGLRFNRAWLFLAEAGGRRLRGKLGVGHNNPRLARQDWEGDVAEQLDFETFLKQVHTESLHHTPLESITRDFEVELDEGDAFWQVLKDGKRKKIPAGDLVKRLPAAFLAAFNPGECAILPFRAGEAVIGLVVVDNKHNAAPLLDSSLDRLETLLNIAGPAWHAQRQRAQRQAVLDAAYLVMGSVSTRQPLKGILAHICQAASTVTNASGVVLYPLQRSGEPYIYDVDNVVWVGPYHLERVKAKPRTRSISAHILRTDMLVVEDVTAVSTPLGPDLVSEIPFVKKHAIRAFLGVPVRSVDANTPLGVLYLNYDTPQHFTSQDRQQASSFAYLASLAIHNARVSERELRDLDEALARGQTSQRELEILRTVMEEALARPAEDSVIRTLLSKVGSALNLTGSQPFLVLRRWESASLDEEPQEIHQAIRLDDSGILHSLELTDEIEAAVNTVLASTNCQILEDHLFSPIRLYETATGLIALPLPPGRAVQEICPSLVRFCAVAALVLDNVRRQEHLYSVLQAARTVTAPISLEQTLESIVQTARHVSPDLSALTLWHLQPVSNQIRFGRAFGAQQDFPEGAIDPAPDSLVWYVVNAREPIWLQNVQDHSVLDGPFVRKEGILSVAAFPLLADDDRIGAMFFNYRRSHFFTDEERLIFPILAEVVATSIRDALHLEDKRRESARLDAALKIADAIGASLEIDQVLDKVLQGLSESFPDTLPCLLTYDEEDRLLEFTPASRSYFPITNPSYQGLRTLHIEDTAVACRVARRSLETQRMVLENIADTQQDSDYLDAIQSTSSELCVSLMSAERLLGVLVLERSIKHGFAQEDEKLLLAIAAQISLAIDRAQKSRRLNFQSAVATATAWAADMAHDLNREVGAIRQLAYLIRQKSTDPEAVNGFAAQIEESALRLVETNPMQMPPSRIQLDPFISHWIEVYANRRRENIQARFELDCPGIAINANPAAFQRILRQLVRNAAQAMADAPQRLLVVRSRLDISDPASPAVEIQFEDTGPGVDESVRYKLFQEPASTKHDQGGFGLLLTRQMVEDMGGRIRLLAGKSEGGAIFSLRLPVDGAPGSIGEGSQGENGS